MFTTIFVSVGGFDENQLVVGAVAGFNLWNYDMNADELNALTCGNTGNVLTYFDFTVSGATFSNDDFACSKYM